MGVRVEGGGGRFPAQIRCMCAITRQRSSSTRYGSGHTQNPPCMKALHLRGGGGRPLTVTVLELRVACLSALVEAAGMPVKETPFAAEPFRVFQAKAPREPAAPEFSGSASLEAVESSP